MYHLCFRSDLKVKESKVLTLQDQLDKASRQLESAQQTVKRLEVSQTPGRRASVTPHKRDRESSITIGTSADLDPQQRIAELECKLAEREQETRDLEVKLFEASFTSQSAKFNAFDEDAPLPTTHKTAARTLFDDEPLPASRKPESRNEAFSNNMNKHKV